MKIAIGIDLGGTNVSAGAVDTSGKIFYSKKIETEAEKGKEQVFEDITGLIQAIINEAQKNNFEIRGVGLGSPGPINLEKGVICQMPNLPGWENVPIIKLLRKRFPYLIELNNDANCALLAEHWIGAAKGAKNCLGLTLGTGIGGAIISNNKLYTGTSGGAGELGHMVIDQNGPICGCGQKGCLESFIGGANFLKKAQKEGNFSQVEDVFQKAREKNPEAQKLVNYYTNYLSLGLANLINIFNPEIIVLAGQITKSADLFLGKTKKITQKSCFQSSWRDCRIEIAKLKDSAGLLGAARLVLE